MLATKRSVVVVPEVNLRIPLHAVDKVRKSGSTQVHTSKTGVSVAPQIGPMSSKKFKNKQERKSLIY